MTRADQPSFPRSHLVGYVALCLIWGSTWLAIRIAVQDIPPLEAAAIRFFAAAALLTALAAAQRKRWPRDPGQWIALLVLSVTMIAIPYGLLFWAEQYVTSSMTAVLYSAMPLAVALFTPMMTHRTVPRRAVFAMVVAFGGLLTVFIDGLSYSGRAMMGGAAVLLAMLMSSWSAIYAKARLHDVDSVVATALQLLFGGVMLAWATWALEAHRHAVWTHPALWAMVFLTLFGSCAAFVIYYWLLKKMQPYQLSTISLIVPVIAVLEGALIRQEPVPLLVALAIIVILGAVGAVLLARNQNEQPKDASGRVLISQEEAAASQEPAVQRPAVQRNSE
ncbi:MAG: EamA family transporter [Acidobacteriia bacterium]|nr:EamA family transporter [Terriglobia bacterium]